MILRLILTKVGGPYGSPCSWASDRKLEDAQERAAHYALTYLKRKHPDVPLDTSQVFQFSKPSAMNL